MVIGLGLSLMNLNNNRSSKADEVLLKLLEIEREMRAIGVWDESLNAQSVNEQSVNHAREHGSSPVGTMPFERWLQCVFIPNARHAAQNNSLPKTSQVSLMAMREYDYQSYVPEAQKLLRLLQEFDALF